MEINPPYFADFLFINYNFINFQRFVFIMFVISRSISYLENLKEKYTVIW